MIAAMRIGENLCLDIDSFMPDLQTFNIESTFDAEKFFDYDYFN